MEDPLEGMIKTGEDPLAIAGLVCSNFEQASQKQQRENMSKLFALLALSFEIQARENNMDRVKSQSDEELLATFLESIEHDQQTAMPTVRTVQGRWSTGVRCGL